jgi:hypothetical protein
MNYNFVGFPSYHLNSGFPLINMKKMLFEGLKKNGNPTNLYDAPPEGFSCGKILPIFNWLHFGTLLDIG